MSHQKHEFNPRMAKSRATNMMRSIFLAHMEADNRGVPVEQIFEEQRKKIEANGLYERGHISRREFLHLIGLAAGLAFLQACAPPPTKVPSITPTSKSSMLDPRVVIIGAGVAGLNCAYDLSQKSITAEIYEASIRLGGRTRTNTTVFSSPVEQGGEYISTYHKRVLALAAELGLSVESFKDSPIYEGEEIYLIDNEFYTYDDANADWRLVWKAFKKELKSAPWLQTYNSFTPRGQELDNISIPEWFDPASPYSSPLLAELGSDSRFAKLCYADVIAAYGGDHDMQPALNLLYMLAWNPGNSLSLSSPGYYHIEGGNQRIAESLADNLQDQIHFDTALEAITGDAAGPYTCHFSNGTTAVADKLVLALPFRILRELDIDARIWDGMRPEKQLAITEMPMGTNAKIHVELDHRTWGPGNEQVINGKEIMLDGTLYTDPDDIQCLWDASVLTESGPVQLTYFPGGTQGANLLVPSPFGQAEPADVNRILAAADKVFPGTKDAYTGKSLKSFWAASPWQKGAYSYWGLGGYTSYLGAAGLVEGNIHFAGEHTSTEASGYIEGAVESGSRAAEEILGSI
ncbi:MAG: NAD(P)-binding protein [Chloroflexi bacterium]|nr:NAD(P)-binding protein [Chloroflexota bacterium]